MSSDMRVAKDKYVQFTYRITDESGGLVEHIDTPIDCVFGRHNRLYERIEAAMLGAVAGDKVSVLLGPLECEWGEPNPNLVFTDSIANIPEEYHRVGAEMEFNNRKGEVKPFIVTKIDGDMITVDGNHRLAGKSVNFAVKIIEVRDATGAELVEGLDSESEDKSLTGQQGTLH